MPDFSSVASQMTSRNDLAPPFPTAISFRAFADKPLIRVVLHREPTQISSIDLARSSNAFARNAFKQGSFSYMPIMWTAL